MKIKHLMNGQHDTHSVFDRSTKPSAILYIDGVQQHSMSLKDCFNCNFHYTYDSKLIEKTAKISFEIRDENYDSLILDHDHTEDSIDNYLNHRIRFAHTELSTSYLETIAFWKDEYEMTPISKVFLADKSSNKYPIIKKVHKQLTPDEKREREKYLECTKGSLKNVKKISPEFQMICRRFEKKYQHLGTS